MPQWSVPANVLLAGEYAITRPGGVGIALAVAPRGTVRVLPQQTRESALSFRRAFHTVGVDLEKAKDGTTSIPGLSVHTIMGPNRVSAESGILRSVLVEVAGFIRDAGEMSYGTRPVPNPPAEITLDTSAFFDPATGRKTGLGSSAAATVLLTASFFYLAGLDPLQNRNTLLGVAVRAHRRLQDGRGSGYDIACSTLGGAIRFIGGEIPRWERLDLMERWRKRGIELCLWRGEAPVNSSRAVEAFDRVFPPGRKADTFLDTSNNAVDTLARAETWDDLVESLHHCRGLAEKTGREIGVPADLPRQLKSHDLSWVAKPTGAGNEQAVIIGRGRDLWELGNLRDARAAGRIMRLVPDQWGLREESS